MDLKSLIPFGGTGGLSRGSDDPFTSLRREMDRMFDDFTRGWHVPAALSTNGFLTPKMNVAETDRGLEITAELPGIDQKDIEVDVADGVLTVMARHKDEKEERDEKKHFHIVERTSGTFLRRLAVPFPPDEDKVEAHFENGVLKIVVPREAGTEKSVRKIEVRGSGAQPT